MGLDMYAVVTCKKVPAVDFKEPKGATELFYWRKHPNLHGWMEQLYRAKGGKCEDFNLTPLRIDSEDLDALEQAVNGNSLPYTEGFFFGTSQPEDKQDDLEFIRRARLAIEKGLRVCYYAWW